MKSSILERYPKAAPLAGLLIAVIVLGGALMLRDRLSNRDSSASCYGYSCEPWVQLWVWPSDTKAPASANLTVSPGAYVDFSWSSENVDKCKAEKAWTKFTGTYYPPTRYPKAITKTEVFTVSCTRNNKVVAKSSVTVYVKQ